MPGEQFIQDALDILQEDAKPEEKVLHLKTQNGQPYGSERRCCEICGVMIWNNSLEKNHPGHGWTDETSSYNDRTIWPEYARCFDREV
jgi:hypothetical protein